MRIMENNNSTKAGTYAPPHSADKQPDGVVPLMALVKRRRILIFDAAAITSANFEKFTSRYRKLLAGQARGMMKIPKFESDRLKDNAPVGIMPLIEILPYGEPGGYKELLKGLKPSVSEKGCFCFITGSNATRRNVIAAAREAGIYVQIFVLNEDGEITFPQKDKSSQSGNKPSGDRRPERTHPAEAKKTKNQQSSPFHIIQQPERIKIEPLSTVLRPASGITVYDSRRQPICLGQQIMTHSNASTYSCDREGMSAKIYNPKTLTTLLRDKCLRMLGGHLKYKGLCWPVEALYDSVGVFVGYLLPTPKGEPLHLSVFKQAGMQKSFPCWNKLNLCRLAMTILRIVQYLHSNNVLMGCLNPSAIRVVSDTEVYFVDTDNYQVDGFPSLLYNTSFTPPELLGRPMYLASLANENYAVALLTFMLMMPGKMPYIIAPDRPPEDSIRQGRFPFPFGNVHGYHANPGVWRFMWSHLSPFKSLFYNTFQKGGSLNAPEARKPVGAIIGTLRYFMEELENPTDPESLNLVPRTFKRSKGETFYACSCCGVEYPQFYFYKDKVGNKGVCNSCIDKRSDVSFTCHACGKTYYYSNRMASFHSMMREQNSSWRKQRYCSDCKQRTEQCVRCGKEVPEYALDKAGRCRDCVELFRNEAYATRECCDCGRDFVITNGEHSFNTEKGFSDPRRCKACREKRKKN